jgi:hypothetical protein
MISAREEYCHSVHKSGDYEIQIHTGVDDHDLFFVECYTDIQEDIDRFDAEDYADLTSKLADRGAIFNG